jgi:hypothetical protein
MGEEGRHRGELDNVIFSQDKNRPWEEIALEKRDVQTLREERQREFPNTFSHTLLRGGCHLGKAPAAKVCGRRRKRLEWLRTLLPAL